MPRRISQTTWPACLSGNKTGQPLQGHLSLPVFAPGFANEEFRYTKQRMGVFSPGPHWRSLEHCLPLSVRTKELQNLTFCGINVLNFQRFYQFYI